MVEPTPITDPFEYLGFTKTTDGSFTRQLGHEHPKTPVSGYSDDLFVHEFPLNPSRGIWIRLFLPRQVIKSSRITKLPLIIYFHGGGFVSYSAASSSWDNFYRAVTTETPTALASVEYRLAPENKLPAAYDDGTEAFHWINNSNNPLLTKYADFSNVFISGTSAGANLAYQLGLRVAKTSYDLKPLKIKGLILIEPFIGGIKRTESEEKAVNEPYSRLPPIITDALWELALPVGFDRDHEYCNPKTGMKKKPYQFDKIKALGWHILVTGYEGDPMIDRQRMFAGMLEAAGVKVNTVFCKGGYHGYEFVDKEELEHLVQDIKQFVTQDVPASLVIS